jgi:hypothetical protein
MMPPHYILPGRRNFSNKHCRGNQNTQFMSNMFPKIIPLTELQKNTIQSAQPIVTEHNVPPKKV